jgi:predicted GNAT family acetyltransferase
MLADTPLAYVETVADAEARPPELWTTRAKQRSTGCDGAAFVAEQGGRLVGAANGYPDDRGRTWVVGVYVAPAHRGSGLIERLVGGVAEWSLACGRTELVLEVAQQNPRAVAAYARLGFTATGATAAHPLYPDITEQEMTRPARWPATAPS